MSIHLLYVEGSSENLRCILRSHKIRNQKIEQLQKIKNNVVYEIDCGNCETVYFGDSKRSLKSFPDERNRSVWNYNCEKNEIPKNCWITIRISLIFLRMNLFSLSKLSSDHSCDRNFDHSCDQKKVLIGKTGSF